MFLATVVLLGFFSVSGVWAQSEMAQCHPGYEWNRNSLNQGSCTVGSMLDASCRGLVTYNYPPVNASESYRPPRRGYRVDLNCNCNTVMYNLYMACATCQGGWIYLFMAWLFACDTVYISQYPHFIPQGTAVPRWAFFNATSSVNQMYDQATMISIGRDPEEMPSSVSTSSILRSTVPPRPTSNSSSDTEGGTNRVGPIVGGVLGSVVLLVIIAVMVFLYTRHRRKQKVQPRMLNRDGLDPYEQRPSMYGTPITSDPFTSDNPSDPLTLPPQNPSDPLTFPSSEPLRFGIHSEPLRSTDAPSSEPL